ncbi:hypothetical protein CLOSTASPAR_04472 [[Clostridium] asparagiforme DSM 15981]|uniref:Uncharacterized protein n=1 Tax=[Clostridium] asparagiforme DSM 15981 TaxID=518636 RepID=C0D5C6_9FIRM|nr:hypothetical protein CLOSTASPAR_04472 [[Clostridium] asparagiforme DSM 15981]
MFQYMAMCYTGGNDTRDGNRHTDSRKCAFYQPSGCPPHNGFPASGQETQSRG